MKYYLIIGSIILVLLLGSLFLFTEQTIEVDTIDFKSGETEKALDALEYNIKFPTFIPKDLIMKDASISIINGIQRMIGFSYKNPMNSYGFEFYASLNDDPLKSIVENDEYWEWEKIKINDRVAYIGVHDSSNEINLIFREENILYRFYSYVMETEEILKIASSLE